MNYGGDGGNVCDGYENYRLIIVNSKLFNDQ